MTSVTEDENKQQNNHVVRNHCQILAFNISNFVCSIKIPQPERRFHFLYKQTVKCLLV